MLPFQSLFVYINLFLTKLRYIRWNFQRCCNKGVAPKNFPPPFRAFLKLDNRLCGTFVLLQLYLTLSL